MYVQVFMYSSSILNIKSVLDLSKSVHMLISTFDACLFNKGLADDTLG